MVVKAQETLVEDLLVGLWAFKREYEQLFVHSLVLFKC